MRNYLKVTLLSAIISLSGCSDDRVLNMDKFEKCMGLATKTSTYMSYIMEKCEDIAKEPRKR